MYYVPSKVNIRIIPFLLSFKSEITKKHNTKIKIFVKYWFVKFYIQLHVSNNFVEGCYRNATPYDPLVASILEGTAASIFRVEELFNPEYRDSRFITIYQTTWCHIQGDGDLHSPWS